MDAKVARDLIVGIGGSAGTLAAGASDFLFKPINQARCGENVRYFREVCVNSSHSTVFGLVGRGDPDVMAACLALPFAIIAIMGFFGVAKGSSGH